MAIRTTSSASRSSSSASTFGSFTTEARAEFLNRIAATLPEGLTHLQLFSGGAEAVEAAFRLAKSVTKKFEFIGFWGGFHGKSQGVIGLLGGAYRNHQGPFPPGMHHSPYAELLSLPIQPAASVLRLGLRRASAQRHQERHAGRDRRDHHRADAGDGGQRHSA